MYRLLPRRVNVLCGVLLTRKMRSPGTQSGSSSPSSSSTISCCSGVPGAIMTLILSSTASILAPLHFLHVDRMILPLPPHFGHLAFNQLRTHFPKQKKKNEKRKKEKGLRHLHLRNHAHPQLLNTHNLALSMALVALFHVSGVVSARTVAVAADMVFAHRQFDFGALVHVFQRHRHINKTVRASAFLRLVASSSSSASSKKAFMSFFFV
jgi:hypothetical protein